MSATDYILGLFGLGTSEDVDELEQLRDLLAEREAELSLSATYGRPYPSMLNEPTVVFPYTLYTGEGEEYGARAKEFALPDNGLSDNESALVRFVAERLNIEPSEVDFDALCSVEGSSANARINERGDVEVDA